MANRWGNNGNSGWLYFGGLQITADGDCSHEIKRRFLLGRKAMTNWDNILKTRNTYFADKVRLVRVILFPVVMCGCESWTIKNAECQRIDAFELWYWRRLLRVPWTARRSNHSILKEINPEYSLEGLMLKLKLQYFGHPMAKNWLLGKDPGAGKDWRQEERGRQRMRWLDGITDSMEWVWINSRSWWWTRRPGVLQSMGLQRVGHDWATELHRLNSFSTSSVWFARSVHHTTIKWEWLI